MDNIKIEVISKDRVKTNKIKNYSKKIDSNLGNDNKLRHELLIAISCKKIAEKKERKNLSKIRSKTPKFDYNYFKKNFQE